MLLQPEEVERIQPGILPGNPGFNLRVLQRGERTQPRVSTLGTTTQIDTP